MLVSSGVALCRTLIPKHSAPPMARPSANNCSTGWNGTEPSPQAAFCLRRCPDQASESPEAEGSTGSSYMMACKELQWLVGQFLASTAGLIQHSDDLSPYGCKGEATQMIERRTTPPWHLPPVLQGKLTVRAAARAQVFKIHRIPPATPASAFQALLRPLF